MKKIGLMAALACLIPFGAALADEASKIAKVEEMYRLTKTEEMMQRSLEQVRAMQSAQISRMNLSTQDKAKQQQIMDAISKLVADRLSWEKLKPRFVAIWAEAFTDAELDGILAFYRSPSGKALVEKTPQFMGKTMGIIQETMQQLAPEIQRIVGDAAPAAPAAPEEKKPEEKK